MHVPPPAPVVENGEKRIRDCECRASLNNTSRDILVPGSTISNTLINCNDLYKFADYSPIIQAIPIFSSSGEQIHVDKRKETRG